MELADVIFLPDLACAICSVHYIKRGLMVWIFWTSNQKLPNNIVLAGWVSDWVSELLCPGSLHSIYFMILIPQLLRQRSETGTKVVGTLPRSHSSNCYYPTFYFMGFVGKFRNLKPFFRHFSTAPLPLPYQMSWIFGYHGYSDIMTIQTSWISRHHRYLDITDIRTSRIFGYHRY